MCQSNCNCKNQYPSYGCNVTPYPYKGNSKKHISFSIASCSSSSCEGTALMWREKSIFGEDILVTKYPNGKISKKIDHEYTRFLCNFYSRGKSCC